MQQDLNILGFHCYGHDSAAALLSNGAVRMAVEEERLNRKKHSPDFPVAAIRTCLAGQGIDAGDLDHVGFAWKPSLTYRHIPLYAFRFFPRIFALIRESREWTTEQDLAGLSVLNRIRKLPSALRSLVPSDKTARFRFHFLEHHMCHAASAFYPSPFDEAAILTVDGSGEWTTAMLASGRGTRLRKISTVNTPHSLGAFYHAVSRYLGFEYIDGPGKLMGLAAYGNPNAKEYRKLSSMVHLSHDGRFQMDMRYFGYHYTRKKHGLSDKFYEAMGPANKTAQNWTDAQLNIAAGTQRIVEETLLHMVRQLHRFTGLRNLCIAGGVGLNSVANGRLVKESPFDNIFIQPAAGDSGTALGAAFLIHHGILHHDRSWRMKTACLGPDYPRERYASALDQHHLPWIESDHYTSIAAQLLAKGKIIGWFQGRLEFGPRALGHRSILANPSVHGMKDALNEQVKHRESFRPFGAVVMEDRCGEYFDCKTPSPFMLNVYHVLEHQRQRLCAVTHVDGSGRVQTVTRQDNPEMHGLLSAFEKETGVPVLLNTSFNIKGTPIVCSPEDAVACFMKTGIDVLIMGRLMTAKQPDDLVNPAITQGPLHRPAQRNQPDILPLGK